MRQCVCVTSSLDRERKKADLAAYAKGECSSRYEELLLQRDGVNLVSDFSHRQWPSTVLRFGRFSACHALWGPLPMAQNNNWRLHPFPRDGPQDKKLALYYPGDASVHLLRAA